MKVVFACFFFLVIFCRVSPGFCQTSPMQESELTKAGIHLIPYPREVKLEGADFRLEGPLTIVLDKNATENDRFAATQLTDHLNKDLGIITSFRKTPAGKSIILSRKGADKKTGEEGYTLQAGQDRVIIRAGGEAGLFYGVQTLLQLIQKDKPGASANPDASANPGASVTPEVSVNPGSFIKGLEITDWPDTKTRAVHYDTKHHQDSRAFVESFIRDLARVKINMLVWEWEDKFEYPSHPEIGAPGAFTMKEIQELTYYARRYHIQIVPLVQGLGHVSFLLKWPRYAHLREIPASNFEFCPLKEGAYQLLFDLWADAIKATPGSEYVHIGSDETFELGLCPQCREKTKEIGKSGLYHLFVGKSASHLQEAGRKVMVWEKPMGWEVSDKEKVLPQKGLILTEECAYETADLQYAKKAKELGYPVYAYDPNPGIEQLFLPYFFRKDDSGRKISGSLENSYAYLTTHLGKGVYDGMIRTSWDDSGLPMQAWMLTFVVSAAYSWNAAAPSLPEFTKTFFKYRYGDEAVDIEKLFGLLNEGAYFYMESFERKVWAWGEIGKTHLPDLPRGDALEYDPFWNTQYAQQVKTAGLFLEKMNKAITITDQNLGRKIKNREDMEVFKTTLALIRHTALTWQDLSALEYEIKSAHNQQFLSHEEAWRHLEKAEKVVKGQLARREKVFNELVAVWQRTELPKGMSTDNKKYFFEQDRARHFANRAPDMTYLIINEQQLDLEGYLLKLQQYKDFYKQRFLVQQ